MIAPLALMGLIFFLSAQPDLGTDLGWIDLVGRKIAHAGVYFALTLLWYWALWPVLGNPSLRAAAAIAVLYAVSDEYHQTFVDGRVGSPIDVAIDAVGIACAYLSFVTGALDRVIDRLRDRVGISRVRDRDS